MNTFCCKMEFPISRKRLRNYLEDEAVEANTKAHVCQEVKKICANVEKVILANASTKYVYQIPESVKHGMQFFHFVAGSHPRQATYPGILKDLLDALKLMFPDSDIVTDPLETYIIIDWS